jgi:sporulation protein YunB
MNQRWFVRTAASNIMGGAAMRRRWGSPFDAIKKWTAPKPIPRKWGGARWGWKAVSGMPGNLSSRGLTPRRPRRKRNRKQLWVIVLLLVLFATIQTFVFIEQKLKEPLMFLAQVRVKQLATDAINAAITREIADSAVADKMIQWKMDHSGKVSGFLIDFKEQMKLTSRAVTIVDQVLKEKEHVPDHIPIGHALNSPLLSAIGPKIAVTFHPVSVVKAEMDTRQTEVAINMLLVEVFIRIRTEVAVVIPFDREPEVLETEIPLSYALVVGDIPMYYYDGKGNPVGNGAANAPSIVLPAPDRNASHDG